MSSFQQKEKKKKKKFVVVVVVVHSIYLFICLLLIFVVVVWGGGGDCNFGSFKASVYNLVTVIKTFSSLRLDLYVVYGYSRD